MTFRLAFAGFFVFPVRMKILAVLGIAALLASCGSGCCGGEGSPGRPAGAALGKAR